jgi:hypothetical protein
VKVRSPPLTMSSQLLGPLWSARQPAASLPASSEPHFPCLDSQHEPRVHFGVTFAHKITSPKSMKFKFWCKCDFDNTLARNHCFSYPKHLIVRPDFVLKSEFEPGCHTKHRFSASRTSEREKMISKMKEGCPKGSGNHSEIIPNQYVGITWGKVVPSEPKVAPSGPKMIPVDSK